MKKQKDLFGNEVKNVEKINKIDDHWINMPEYNNVNREKPQFIAIIKFRNKEDFKKFSKLARENIYNKDLFWGRYKENVRVAWYPPFERASNYVYINESDNSLDNIDESIDFES